MGEQEAVGALHPARGLEFRVELVWHDRHVGSVVRPEDAQQLDGQHSVDLVLEPPRQRVGHDHPDEQRAERRDVEHGRDILDVVEAQARDDDHGEAGDQRRADQEVTPHVLEHPVPAAREVRRDGQEQRSGRAGQARLPDEVGRRKEPRNRRDQDELQRRPQDADDATAEDAAERRAGWPGL